MPSRWSPWAVAWGLAACTASNKLAPTGEAGRVADAAPHDARATPDEGDRGAPEHDAAGPPTGGAESDARPTDATPPAEDRTGPGSDTEPPPPPDDGDDDGVPDAADNCPTAANHDQNDGDADGQGDACDPCPQAADPSACEVECEVGVTERRPCPAGDPESRRCDDGHWSAWSGCAECEEGALQRRPCAAAPAVEQERRCADGAWSEWSACAPECEPGAREERPCAGTPAVSQTRDCPGGRWSEWSECQPECEPGTSQERDCDAAGRPGSQTRACEGGLWRDWGACVPDADCEPGQTQHRPCGLNGNGEDVRECEQGAYGPWMCDDPDECLNGDTRRRACEEVQADQVSTCQGGRWSAFTPCPAPGPCDAPAAELTLEPDAQVTLDVDTRRGANDFGAGCLALANGPEQLVAIHVPAAGFYRFSFDFNTFDTVMSLRSDCRDVASELACNDDGIEGLASDFLVELAEGDYTLLIDGAAGASGFARLLVEPAPEPEGCAADADNQPADATPIDPRGAVSARALCPPADQQDYYGFELPFPGLLFATVVRTGPPVAGEAIGSFLRNNGGVGQGTSGNAQWSVRVYAPEPGAYEFMVATADLAGFYGYDLQLDYSESIACDFNPRPGCIQCFDAWDPNDDINESRALALNTDAGLLGICGSDFDFYSVQLAAGSDFRVVVDIQAMLGEMAVIVTNGRDSVPLNRAVNGLRYTYSGRVPAAGRYHVNIRMNPGEAAYRLRVEQ